MKRRLLLALLVVASAAVACSLNPQPIPPGVDDPANAGRSDAKTGSDAASPPQVSTGGGDAGSGSQGSDAATPDGASNGVTDDGGVTDAAADGTIAPGDAASDAPAD